MRFYINSAHQAASPGVWPGPEWAYVSRFTVIGIAPLLNSIHAISIGSTTPLGTSMRIGDPILIWRARAPIMRAFSNRVYRIGCPSHRAAAEGRLETGRDGR